MKKEIKDRWVQALRSGEYKQGKGVLRQGENFCCLGVLCDITKEELGIEWTHARYGNYIDGERVVLPPRVRDYAGLTKRNPEIEGMTLSDTNDSGADFDVIADLIEKNWEIL